MNETMSDKSDEIFQRNGRLCPTKNDARQNISKIKQDTFCFLKKTKEQVITEVKKIIVGQIFIVELVLQVKILFTNIKAKSRHS